MPRTKETGNSLKCANGPSPRPNSFSEMVVHIARALGSNIRWCYVRIYVLLAFGWYSKKKRCIWRSALISGGMASFAGHVTQPAVPPCKHDLWNMLLFTGGCAVSLRVQAIDKSTEADDRTLLTYSEKYSILRSVLLSLDKQCVQSNCVKSGVQYPFRF
jgi:hypothetical protein